MPQGSFANPVLDAYIQGVGMRRQQEQDVFKQKMDEAANKRAEEQLKLYGEHVKKQEEAENARLDMERTRIALERQSKEMQARQQIAEMIGKGQATVRPATQGEQLSTPAAGMYGGIDPRTIQFSTPEQILANDLNRASKMGEVQAKTQGAITSAKETAKAPFEQAADTRRFTQAKEMSQLGQTQKIALQELEGKQRLEQIAKTIEGQKAVAAINGKFDLDRARITNFTGISSPDEWSSAVLSRALGQAPLGTSKKDELIRAHVSAAGYVPFDPKDAAKLKELHSMDPLVRQMKDIMAKLPEDVVNAAGEKITAKVPLTETNNLAGLIKGVSGNIARIIGGEKGVLTERDINRAGALLVQPGITVKQAKERLAFFLDNLTSKGLGVYLGGMSPKQQLLVLRNYDFDPEIYNRTLEHAGKKGYAFKKAPDGEWGYFDTKTGQYRGLDE